MARCATHGRTSSAPAPCSSRWRGTARPRSRPRRHAPGPPTSTSRRSRCPTPCAGRPRVSSWPTRGSARMSRSPSSSVPTRWCRCSPRVPSGGAEPRLGLGWAGVRAPTFDGVLETALYHAGDAREAIERFYGEVLGLPAVAGWPDVVAFRVGGGVLLLFDRERLAQRDGPIADHGATGPGHVCLLVGQSEHDQWRERLAAAGRGTRPAGAGGRRRRRGGARPRPLVVLEGPGGNPAGDRRRGHLPPAGLIVYASGRASHSPTT